MKQLMTKFGISLEAYQQDLSHGDSRGDNHQSHTRVDQVITLIRSHAELEARCLQTENKHMAAENALAVMSNRVRELEEQLEYTQQVADALPFTFGSCVSECLHCSAGVEGGGGAEVWGYARLR